MQIRPLAAGRVEECAHLSGAARLINDMLPPYALAGVFACTDIRCDGDDSRNSLLLLLSYTCYSGSSCGIACLCA